MVILTMARLILSCFMLARGERRRKGAISAGSDPLPIYPC